MGAGQGYQPTDFPPVSNALYVAQDAGTAYQKDLELPFTTHPEAAQRIAKVILEKARQGITVDVKLNHSGLKFSTWDTVTYTQEHLGWGNKVFRVKSMKMDSVPDGAVTLTLQEESAASYDWNAGEATLLDPAPDTDLPDPFTVQPPGALAVTESLYVTRNGDGVKARATLSWGESPDGFVDAYQPEYKARSAASWTLLPRTANATADIDDAAPGEYDFRVKAVNSLGVSSPYSTASRQLSGLLAPPTAPQTLTISTIGGLAILRWDLSPDLDVRVGGKIAFRHSPNSGDGWAGSTSVGNAVPGGDTVAVLPLKPGIYLAKAVDSAGVESVSASGVTTEQATALAWANVTSLTEHPTFGGTKTNCVVASSKLKLDSGALFDSIADLDAVPDLDAHGGIVAGGTYAPSGSIDLGSVRRVRLTSNVRAAVVNQLDMVDDRTAPIDEWDSFDGTVAASADATAWARKTNDDPAGSPVWTAWQRLDSAEYAARAFQFELRLSSSDPAYNIEVSEFSISIDEVS